MFKVDVYGREIEFTFRHEHFEEPESFAGSSTPIKAQTICTIKGIPGTNEVWGLANCSVKDNFNKETARKISLTRALKMSGLNKDCRTVIWDRYHNRYIPRTQSWDDLSDN